MINVQMILCYIYDQCLHLKCTQLLQHGLCHRCSETKKSLMYIQQPKKAPQFSTIKDLLSVLPNEFLFFVGRHTGGAPMDCEHCSRAEGVCHQ